LLISWANQTPNNDVVFLKLKKKKRQLKNKESRFKTFFLPSPPPLGKKHTIFERGLVINYRLGYVNSVTENILQNN
jgi:hypothetical protein